MKKQNNINLDITMANQLNVEIFDDSFYNSLLKTIKECKEKQ